MAGGIRRWRESKQPPPSPLPRLPANCPSLASNETETGGTLQSGCLLVLPCNAAVRDGMLHPPPPPPKPFGVVRRRDRRTAPSVLFGPVWSCPVLPGPVPPDLSSLSGGVMHVQASPIHPSIHPPSRASVGSEMDSPRPVGSWSSRWRTAAALALASESANLQVP